MFFFLSKLADLLASPLTWALLLLAFALWRGRGRFPRHRRIAVYAPAAAALILYAFSTGPVSNALVRSLEVPALQTMKPDVTYDAVIVLGGMLDAEASESSGTIAYTDSVERVLAAYDALRNGRARFALLSGGSSNARVTEAVEARVLARQLTSWGILPERLVVEDQSRNTRENAVESARIIAARRWSSLLLVTSAFHMKRAAGCFRAVGLTFDMLSVDFRSYAPAQFSGGLLPRADRLSESTAALREHLGRLVYRVQGYTKDEP